MDKKIKNITAQFLIDEEISSISCLTSGHINDTYLIVTSTNLKYVLQKINSNVFPKAALLIANKVLVSKHLQKRSSEYEVIHYVKTKAGNYSIVDEDFSHWNMMQFIKNSFTHDRAKNSTLVYHSGKLYGDFITQVANLDANKLTEILPDFHNMFIRYKQFDAALSQAKEERIKIAKNEIEFVQASKKEMHELHYLKERNCFPIRVTHNDSKLSNILFDEKDRGLAVIDLDTVMPGIIHFDFGDSIRSICSTATEDQTNLNEVEINLKFYEAYCKGFAESTKKSLTALEIKYLPLGAKTITFIMGLRFLTDYLNGNTYYKVKHDLHNLDRAKNQFQLVKDIQQKFAEMLSITKNAYSK